MQTKVWYVVLTIPFYLYTEKRGKHEAQDEKVLILYYYYWGRCGPPATTVSILHLRIMTPLEATIQQYLCLNCFSPTLHVSDLDLVLVGALPSLSLLQRASHCCIHYSISTCSSLPKSSPRRLRQSLARPAAMLERAKPVSIVTFTARNRTN